MMKSNLDLVNECDVFPYVNKDPSAHASLLSTLYALVWDDGETETPVGYMLESIFKQLAKVPTKFKGEIEVNRSKRTIAAFSASQFPTEDERSKAVAATTAYWRENKTFQLLDGWRDELYPVYGPGNQVLFSIERSASTLLGVVTYGVHMTAYTVDEKASHGIRIWIPRRAKEKTYSGMLDNTVAGGIATGEAPFECLVRECDEEASLSEDLVRNHAKAVGKITYMYVRSPIAGGESGMIQPECQYVFDLELPRDVIPKPNDNEVQEFHLWTVEQVQEHLANGEFKPNCALVMLDFFIRHGILTPENESNFEEIEKRIHRNVEFPGPHKT